MKNEKKEKRSPETSDFEAYKNAWHIGAISNRSAIGSDRASVFNSTPKKRNKNNK